jgi:predicted RNase H-like nuclease
VGAQAFGIYRRIREFDEILCRDPILRRNVYEVHPEVSFMAWNGGEAISASKKSPQGKAIRVELVRAYFGAEAFQKVRANHARGTVADDDIADAFAALWTAVRIFRGSVQVLPDPPESDREGLQMCMWY